MLLTLQELMPLISFAFVASITPGPNNIMLTASAIRFGLPPTLPHILGIPFGFGIQLILCAYGLGILLTSNPTAYLLLKIIGTTYLIYLAWCLRHNMVRDDLDDNPPSHLRKAKPMSFMQAALFQFANPKAWIMAMTGAAVFIPSYESFILSVVVLCGVFCMINLPCVGLWALLGSSIKYYLHKPLWQSLFSATIVLLTLYSAVAIWL